MSRRITSFFIFIVANVGGCLTPIGDPPLFLGYLQGVPFWWVAEHCWPMWAVGIGLLLAIFYVVDKINFRRAPLAVREKPQRKRGGSTACKIIFSRRHPWRGVYKNNFCARDADDRRRARARISRPKNPSMRQTSLIFTPIQKVAILFAGIFATMMPALDWLNQNAPRLLGEHPAPGVFYWGTGVLSGALDNAPTYLGFLSALSGVAGTSDIHELLAQQHQAILAISVGAVFFGAFTYIGNGPNFMVKAIAEQQKVSTPGFFGFIFKFALPFLLPVLVVVWLAFFRG